MTQEEPKYCPFCNKKAISFTDSDWHVSSTSDEDAEFYVEKYICQNCDKSFWV